MPDTAAIERGRRFESEVPGLLGLASTPNSGAVAHDKSDAKGQLRVSCKSTTKKRSWTETRHQMDEAIEMAFGTGELPALAIEDPDGERFFIMRLSDMAEFLTEHAPVQRKPSRAEITRERASLPALLRESC